MGVFTMIYSLKGTLIFSDISTAVVECAGVGYGCRITLNTYRRLPDVGKEVFLHTFMVVREDAMELYGFYESSELNCYKMLTLVNGVGAKAAISMLSEFTPDQVALYIATGDAKSLTKASGIGAKIAQRIVLELKDKVGSVDLGSSVEIKAAGVASESGGAAEAVGALVALGYSQGEASLTVGRLDSRLSVDELIRGALKALSRQV